jgi:predicted Fe-Mo cluster-binding NifX family protein
MRVAIPISDGWVERVFDSATMLMVIDLRGGGRGEFFETPVTIRSLKERVLELSAIGVDVLLCDEISHALESMIRAAGIMVHTHRSGRADEVAESFIDRHLNEARPSHYPRPVLATTS